MSDKGAERVLVIPAAVLHRAGHFQGFRPDDGTLLATLLDPAHLRYLPRADAEDDPAFKQLIPYVVLRYRDQLFHYTRGSAGTETRLRALRSLGVGGHICAEDGGVFADAYRAGMLREVAEELHLEGPYVEHTLGLINDDRTPVGRVHLGVVHVFDLARPTARPREEALAGCGFAPLEELRRERDQFETWSQFLLEGDHLAAG